MKKCIIACAATLLAVVAVNAQPRAIGGRVAYGVGFSYQHSVGLENMVSLDVEFPGYSRGMGAAATYDWIFPISAWTQKGEWNWYAGVGAGLGFSFPGVGKPLNLGDGNSWIAPSGGFNFGIAGRIGVEYNFWFPLQLSIDWRPVIGPQVYWYNLRIENTVISYDPQWDFNSNGFYAGAICLGVRYRF